MMWPVPLFRNTAEPAPAAPLPLDEATRLRQDLAATKKRLEEQYARSNAKTAELGRVRGELDRVRKELARVNALLDEKYHPIRQAPVAPLCATECRADSTQGECVVAHLRTQVRTLITTRDER